MLLSTIVGLLLLLYINYRIGGRVPVYPPVAFCAVWAAALFLLWAAGNYFLPLSDQTLAIFTCGCIVFSVGSFVVLVFAHKPLRNESFPCSSSRILNLLLVFCVLALPFYVRWIVGLGSDSSAVTLLQAVRDATVDLWGTPPGYTLFMNLATLARILALFAYFEGGPIRKAFAVSLSVVFDLLMGTRSPVITLLLSLVFLEWLRRRRLPWKVLLSLVLLFIVAFSFIAIEVGKGDARPNAPLTENVTAIGRGFIEYAAGGLVAFDQVVRRPNIIPHNTQIDRFFVETLNKLGAHFKLQDDYDTWINIGPSLFNVYTLYLSYIDFGYVGMMAMLFLLGIVITRFYQGAISGSRIAAFIYSTLFAGLFLSIFSEAFFMAINFLVKLCVVYWLIYRFPAVWAKWFAGSEPRPEVLAPEVLRG